MSAKKQIVILGGGFGGIYAALEFEKELRRNNNLEVTLVNQENFILFTPMLHEVAASDLDPTDIVNPIHKLLKRVHFFCGNVDAINTTTKTVTVSHGVTHHSHELNYDHLIVALGCVPHFFNLPGVAEHAMTMKSLGDALYLRNKMIACLEEANFECCKAIRTRLLTFVVAGGGFAGVETAAAVRDFMHGVLADYTNLKKADIRVVLVNSGDTLLPELDAKLGRYAGELLSSRGVEMQHNTKVSACTSDCISLTNGVAIESCNLIWTAGNAAHPLLQHIAGPKEKGRLLVAETLNAVDCDGIWALGDCAAIPESNSTRFHPPTAQHATRQARIVAQNIIATLKGRPLEPFSFRTLGQLASLGHHSGVAQVLGFRFSGFFAWWLWRGIYLAKLPRLEKKVRVALRWILDVLFVRDTVQLPTGRAHTMMRSLQVTPSINQPTHEHSITA